MSEATRRAYARRTPEERVALALTATDDFYAALLAEERAKGGSELEAVRRVRARVRAWQAA